MYQIIVTLSNGEIIKGVCYDTREECQTQINVYREIRPEDEKTWGFKLSIVEAE